MDWTAAVMVCRRDRSIMWCDGADESVSVGPVLVQARQVSCGCIECVLLWLVGSADCK